MHWWDSEPGVKFKEVLTKTWGHKRDVIIDNIWLKTRINPDVIKKWEDGGNPSILYLQKILSHCITDINTVDSIIDGTREFKNKNKTAQSQPLVSSISNPPFLTLTAIIEDYNPEEKKYWVRTYHGNRQLYGDRVGIYGYAFKIINTPTYRSNVINKLGHSNFNIVVDTKLSVPRQS